MPKVVFYTPFITPHQIPWTRRLADLLGHENFRYIYTHPVVGDGWKARQKDEWLVDANVDANIVKGMLYDADVLITGFKLPKIFEARERLGKVSVYSAERWFKPIHIVAINNHIDFCLPGWIKLFWPQFFCELLKMVNVVRKSKRLYLFPMGVHAAKDILIAIDLLRGKFWRLFKIAQITYNNCAGSQIVTDGAPVTGMRLWGYFVSPSSLINERPNKQSRRPIKVLWVGRLVAWKRVHDLVRAAILRKDVISLDIYGKGPELRRLQRLSKAYDNIQIHAPVSNTEVRSIMRNHDIYVLPSNAYEGWGAVVSEALAEGMLVIGTSEAGSSGTMLPKENQYPAGDYIKLANKICNSLVHYDGKGWTSEDAAKYMFDFVSEVTR